MSDYTFRIEEGYNWQDDIMEITRQIVYKTDEARLDNISEHFKVDLSEIRDFIEKKQHELEPQTNADRIRSMTDEELAALLKENCCKPDLYECPTEKPCVDCWLDWLKQGVTE